MHGKTEPLLWHNPNCNRLFSNLVTLYAPLSINYFSHLPQYMKIQNCFLQLHNKHHNVLSAAIEQPPLPQGQEAKKNDSLIHGFTSKFYSRQCCGLSP